ncbi:hypothetical protein P9112_004769 [Eukaryota sp. TZLM1-RC]
MKLLNSETVSPLLAFLIVLILILSVLSPHQQPYQISRFIAQVDEDMQVIDLDRAILGSELFRLYFDGENCFQDVPNCKKLPIDASEMVHRFRIPETATRAGRRAVGDVTCTIYESRDESQYRRWCINKGFVFEYCASNEPCVYLQDHLELDKKDTVFTFDYWCLS